MKNKINKLLTALLLFSMSLGFASQHDYNIANQTGAAFRSDLNDALSAVATTNSGTTSPSTTFAYEMWADSTSGLLKIRNAANSGWVSIGTLASTNLGLLPAPATPGSTLPLLYSSGGVVSTGTITSAQITDNTVANADLRQSAALSVIGNTTNSTANAADIAAANDGEVLRRSGTAIGFGTVAAAGLASNSVTTAKITDANITLAKLDSTALKGIAKAYGNFSGVAVAATYGRSGNTVTITQTTHGMSTGQMVYMTFSAGTGGTATSGMYTITVTGANTYTVTDVASGSITAGATASRTIWLRKSYNVTSIVRSATAVYTVTLTTPFADAYYITQVTAGIINSGSLTWSYGLDSDDPTTYTASTFKIHARQASTGTDTDGDLIMFTCWGDQ